MLLGPKVWFLWCIESQNCT